MSFWDDKPVRKNDGKFESKRYFTFEHLDAIKLYDSNNITNDITYELTNDNEKIEKFLLENNQITPDIKFINWYFNESISIFIIDGNLEKIGFIMARPLNLVVNKDLMSGWIVNYLCIKKDYRNRGLTKILIDLITRELYKINATFSLFGSINLIRNLSPFKIDNNISIYNNRERSRAERYWTLDNHEGLYTIKSTTPETYKKKVKDVIDKFLSNYDVYEPFDISYYFNDVYSFNRLISDSGYNIFAYTSIKCKGVNKIKMVLVIKSHEKTFSNNLNSIIHYLCCKNNIIFGPETISKDISKKYIIGRHKYYNYSFNLDLSDKACYLNLL